MNTPLADLACLQFLDYRPRSIRLWVPLLAPLLFFLVCSFHCYFLTSCTDNVLRYSKLCCWISHIWRSHEYQQKWSSTDLILGKRTSWSRHLSYQVNIIILLLMWTTLEQRNWGKRRQFPYSSHPFEQHLPPFALTSIQILIGQFPSIRYLISKHINIFFYMASIIFKKYTQSFQS